MAILGRMVSWSWCLWRRGLTIAESGGPWFHTDGRDCRLQGGKNLACFRSSQRPVGRNIAKEAESSERGYVNLNPHFAITCFLTSDGSLVTLFIPVAGF